jgi:hypothetical protein
MKCWNLALNAQGSKVIIVVVQESKVIVIVVQESKVIIIVVQESKVTIVVVQEGRKEQWKYMKLQWRRSGGRRKDRMKLSLLPKLVERLVWVPVIFVFVKFSFPSYAFDSLLCRNWPFLPLNRLTLQITLMGRILKIFSVYGEYVIYPNLSSINKEKQQYNN